MGLVRRERSSHAGVHKQLRGMDLGAVEDADDLADREPGHQADNCEHDENFQQRETAGVPPENGALVTTNRGERGMTGERC